MTPFEIVEPTSLGEAVALLDPEDTSIRPVGGATALMLMMKAGVFQPTRLVSLRHIEKRYSEIETGVDGSLRIGALTPLSAVERSEAVRRAVPVVARTMRVLSNVRVRNVATIGGNLAHGDPHMDLPPVLIALGAEVRVVSPAGERTIPVAQLIRGYYETVLAPDELIADLTIPLRAGWRATYLKCTTRAAHDWPALGVAISIASDDSSVREANIVVSAAVERAARLDNASAVLAGKVPDAKLFREAGEVAAEEADVVSDLRGSAGYKKQLIRVYVQRALREVLDQGKGAAH
jgi:carbon-monoxide dehydrogenase medium subunit